MLLFIGLAAMLALALLKGTAATSFGVGLGGAIGVLLGLMHVGLGDARKGARIMALGLWFCHQRDQGLGSPRVAPQGARHRARSLSAPQDA